MPTPLLALIAVILATITLGWPVFSGFAYLVDEDAVEWIDADPGLWPRRPLAGEHVKTLRVPDSVIRTTPRQYSFYVDKGDVNAETFAVFVPRTPPHSKLYVNMLEVKTSIYEPRHSLLFAELPAAALRQANNRIDIIVPAAVPMKAPRSIVFGPAKTVEEFANGYIDLLLWSIIYAIGVGFAAALFGFFAASFLPNRLPLAVPAAISLLVAASSAFVLFEWPPEELRLQPWLRWICETMSANLLLMMLAGEVQPWKKWVKAAFRTATIGLCFLVLIALVSPSIPATALGLGHFIASLTTLSSASLSLWLAVKGPAQEAGWSETQHSIAAVLAFALFLAAIAEIEILGGITHLIAAMFGSVAFVCGLGALMLWMVASLYADFERMAQARFGLSRIVREQQAQLEAQREEIQSAAVKRAVLEERERFSRDVHDGVGGTLVSLLIQARTGALREDALEAGLQQTLADLRLMIDALDHSHATLTAAFSTFRTRMAPAFSAAQIDLDWQQGDLQTCALTQPSHLLYIFRILQEACTNILRHANATRAKILVNYDPQARTLEIDVTDNGTGGTATASGNGLRNMSERAEKIGAAFAAGPRQGAAGWQVRLTVPVK